MKTRSFLIVGACLLLTAALIFSNYNPFKAATQSIDFSQVGPLTPITANQLNQLVSQSQAKLTLVNLWATWCGPCVEEFPYFMDAHRTYQKDGLSLILVSADFISERDGVIQFLASQGVSFESYIKAEKDQTFISGVHPEWSGALPATLLYGPGGKLLEFIPRPVTHKELEEKIKKALGKS